LKSVGSIVPSRVFQNIACHILEVLVKMLMLAWRFLASCPS